MKNGLFSAPHAKMNDEDDFESALDELNADSQRRSSSSSINRDKLRAVVLAYLRSLFPPLDWLPRYDRGKLRADFIAGLATTVMLIPQAFAYAALSGVPPEYGMYSTTVRCVDRVH